MAWGLAEFDAERRGYKDGVEVGINQGIKQGMKEGISQGSQQKAIETAMNLLSMSLSVENIAKATGLEIDEVKALVK